MKKYTLRNLVDEVLINAQEALSYKEIWEKALIKRLDKKLNSHGKTPSYSVSALLCNDIKKENSKYIIISKNPNRYQMKDRKNRSTQVLISKQIQTGSQEDQKNNKKSEFNEIDLHLLLVSFVWYKFKIYSKTIDANKSDKKEKGQNEWIHPDIVGIYFPFGDDYEPQTLKLTTNLACPSYKLYSFELKKKLSFSNLRESYFQAISNSSWANEGYLVAFEIDNKTDLLDELKRLNTAFGIGVIKLRGQLEDCEVMISAKYKESPDIDTLNLLVKNNPDFKNFIENINEDIGAGKSSRIMKTYYEKFFDKQQYEEYCKSKNIK
ncbi:HTH domain-containing protein [Helicobacter sp. 11S03491-1]|uniref:HTH domain-containing protein n=1 Tax=Helicobacter sp. 11S03491-1 TaxID=1476196 RepID=UPI000BA736CB|nr:HTH domain-containing protein [Helicobacter sp. 11S03491-1]PAF42187.1 hypothetical protein BKH45_04370 [Helicobacter sp. 11S03491-1]